MKIAIDTSPLESGHKVRGVGFYLKNLQEALLEYHSEHSYIFFTKQNELSETVDVIHYPYFDSFQRTLPFKKRYKTVVTVHDLTPIVFPSLFPVGVRGRLNWMIQKKALRSVDAVITDSESSTNDVIKKAGLIRNRVFSVYLAAGKEYSRKVNSEEKKAILKKYDLPEKFVLYVGDVTPNKNLPRLLEAVKKIQLPLVMVGKALNEKEYDRSHPWNQDLVAVHRIAEEEKNIHILGFLPTPDVVTLYNTATVFIMPSLYEGFGLPILEAMSAGCPVITTKEGSLGEVAGEAALFVDAYNPESIADGIQNVFGDADLRKKLSEKGVKQAEKFSWKKTAEETVKVYEETYHNTH